MGLVHGLVEAEAVEPLELKGKASPIEAYRLLSVSGEAAAPSRTGGRFVGRERERAAAARERTGGKLPPVEERLHDQTLALLDGLDAARAEGASLAPDAAVALARV